MMKEHPIIFSSEMVRAILDGHKTQTRRVIRPQPPKDLSRYYFDAYNGGPYWNFWGKIDDRMANGIQGSTKDSCQWKCPFGVPGDRLWVRETFCDAHICDLCERPCYRASLKQCHFSAGKNWPSWSPSIHMPKMFTRIWLEVVGVKVERVQGISGSDAIAEGWPSYEVTFPLVNPKDKALAWFQQTWDSLNAKRGFGFEKSPFCWVIEFKRGP